MRIVVRSSSSSCTSRTPVWNLTPRLSLPMKQVLSRHAYTQLNPHSEYFPSHAYCDCKEPHSDNLPSQKFTPLHSLLFVTILTTVLRYSRSPYSFTLLSHVVLQSSPNMIRFHPPSLKYLSSVCYPQKYKILAAVQATVHVLSCGSDESYICTSYTV